MPTINMLMLIRKAKVKKEHEKLKIKHFVKTIYKF